MLSHNAQRTTHAQFHSFAGLSLSAEVQKSLSQCKRGSFMDLSRASAVLTRYCIERDNTLAWRSPEAAERASTFIETGRAS